HRGRMLNLVRAGQGQRLWCCRKARIGAEYGAAVGGRRLRGDRQPKRVPRSELSDARQDAERQLIVLPRREVIVRDVAAVGTDVDAMLVKPRPRSVQGSETADEAAGAELGRASVGGEVVERGDEV